MIVRYYGSVVCYEFENNRVGLSQNCTLQLDKLNKICDRLQTKIA
jgi:hypothetical protein